MAQNKKYAFVQREGDDFSCVKLLEGKYKGIIYKYGKVGFAKDENPDGTLPMKFDYDIFFYPHETNIDKQEFIDYIRIWRFCQLDTGIIINIPLSKCVSFILSHRGTLF